MSLKIIVVGSGISSLSSASFLAKEGHDVTIIEKNNQIGGRARKLDERGRALGKTVSALYRAI